MKTIALSMIFSLAVIVCEQQTLFAPHYTTYGGTSLVASKTSAQNSLVPIAGVNRSVPLAGSNGFCTGYCLPGTGASYNPGNGVISAATEFVKNDVWVVDTGGGLTGNSLQPTPDPNMHLPASTPVEPLSLRPIDNGCPACDFELRFGLAGSAGPGGDDI